LSALLWIVGLLLGLPGMLNLIGQGGLLVAWLDLASLLLQGQFRASVGWYLMALAGTSLIVVAASLAPMNRNKRFVARTLAVIGPFLGLLGLGYLVVGQWKLGGIMAAVGIALVAAFTAVLVTGLSALASAPGWLIGAAMILVALYLGGAIGCLFGTMRGAVRRGHGAELT
jgi:hypothetical protein